MRQIDKRLIIAGIACAGAALFFGTTLLDALDAGVPSTAPAAPVTTRSPASKEAATSPTKPAEVITMQAVNEAVAIDPFSPDRQPSATPYKLPTDPQPEAPPPPPPPPPPVPGFHLLGTIQMPSGSFALIQVDNGTPRQVSVGESMNGYVVQKIDKTSARLAQADRVVDLQISQPSIRGFDQSGGGRRGIQPGRGVGPGRGGQNDAVVQQKMMIQEMQDLIRTERKQGADVIRMPAPRRDTTSLRN